MTDGLVGERLAAKEAAVAAVSSSAGVGGGEVRGAVGGQGGPWGVQCGSSVAFRALLMVNGETTRSVIPIMVLSRSTDIAPSGLV